MDCTLTGAYYDGQRFVGADPAAANLYATWTGLNPQDLDDSRAAQHPWASWTVPGWVVAMLLDNLHDQAESKRKRQVNLLTQELEQVKNKLAESQEQFANAYAAAWKTAEERPEPPLSICTTASDGRSDGDVASLNESSSPASSMDIHSDAPDVPSETEERPEPPLSICTTAFDGRSDGDVESETVQLKSLNESSSPASDKNTHSGSLDVASQTEATESSRFLQLIRLQDGIAENGSEFLPTELFPVLLDFLPVDEVVMFDVRAVSRFFASPKAWVFHLFKLMDIDSLPTLLSQKQMHPVVECFHKCLQAENEEPVNVERGGRLTKQYLLGTSERCRGFLFWIYNLHRWQMYRPDLVHHFLGVCIEGLDYQLVEPTECTFWWMASFLYRVHPWPELRLRIARRMMEIGGVAKEQEIVRAALNELCKLEPVCQCIDRHFLAEFVSVVTSDEALFGRCFYKVSDMADVVLADDLARLVAFRKRLCRAFLKPETRSEVRHEMLELLAG